MKAKVWVGSTGKAQLEITEAIDNSYDWYDGEIGTRFNIDTTNDNYGVRTAQSDYELLSRIADHINNRQQTFKAVTS